VYFNFNLIAHCLFPLYGPHIIDRSIKCGTLVAGSRCNRTWSLAGPTGLKLIYMSRRRHLVQKEEKEVTLMKHMCRLSDKRAGRRRPTRPEAYNLWLITRSMRKLCSWQKAEPEAGINLHFLGPIEREMTKRLWRI